MPKFESYTEKTSVADADLYLIADSADTDADGDYKTKKVQSSNAIASGASGIYQNAIINGEMRLSQRGTSFAAIADDAYSLDRWRYNKNGTMVHTITQDTTDSPSSTEFTYNLKIDCTTLDGVIGAGDYCYITQHIEGWNFRPYWNKTFVLKFWVKSSHKTGTFCVSFINGDSDRSYIDEYTITAQDTWEQKTITVTHDSTGNWEEGNNTGLAVNFILACGTTYHGSADAWQAGEKLATSNQVNCCDSTDNNFYITGVQLSKGSRVYNPRHITLEDELCRRYYTRIIGADSTICDGGFWNQTSTNSNYQFPVEMRTTPDIGYSAGAGLNVLSAGNTDVSSSISSSKTECTAESWELIVNIATSRTAGNACFCRIKDANWLEWDAEL